MAHLFNLWNFYQNSEWTCEFDVTRANVLRVAEASKEFIESCLHSFGVDTPADSWRVTPFRGRYFSDYIGTSYSWKDRWSIGWSIQVQLAEPRLYSQVALQGGPIFADIPDSTWQDDYNDPRHDQGALVIAVAAAPEVVPGDAHRQLLDQVQKAQIDSSQLSVVSRQFADGLVQNRLLVHDISFPASVEKLEGLVLLCKSRGYWVNFREVMTRSAIP